MTIQNVPIMASAALGNVNVQERIYYKKSRVILVMNSKNYLKP